jgi:hypothetical protein
VFELKGTKDVRMYIWTALKAMEVDEYTFLPRVEGFEYIF